MRSIRCYLQFHVCPAHTKPRGNLHALTLLSVLDTRGGTREFVIRRGTPHRPATSSSETRATPPLAIGVTGRLDRPELTLFSSHARCESLMRLRPRPRGVRPGEKWVSWCTHGSRLKGIDLRGHPHHQLRRLPHLPQRLRPLVQPPRHQLSPRATRPFSADVSEVLTRFQLDMTLTSPPAPPAAPPAPPAPPVKPPRRAP